MSKTSRNLIVLALILSAVGIIAWYGYTQNPEYIAKQNMAKAQTAISQQLIGDAAQLLKTVYSSHTSFTDAARKQLQGLLTDQSLQTATAEQAVTAINIVKELETPPDLFSLTWPIIESRKADAPADALQLLDAVADLGGDSELIFNTRKTILEKLVQTQPDNKDYAIELALMYEQTGEFSQIEALLTPHKAQLGMTEGARILGQIYASQNRIQESYDLLLPYTETKLAAFHEAETRYNTLLDDIWKQTIEDLNAGKAPESFYTEYDQADQKRQDEMVQSVYAERRDASPLVAVALEEYRNSASVVPVALDMGMVMLRRAQSLTDEAQRQQELQAAEKTFLAVKGIAGRTDEYRIYLAQVYYWLGKADEGKALFEELLAAKDRDFITLYSISSILRDLGANSEARTLMEEAHTKTKDKDESYAAASFLSLLATTLPERIQWLEKSNPNSLRVQADLNNLRGNEAERNNNLTLAANYYQKTIDSYEKQEKNATTLNNVALVYFSLYRINGDQTALTTGMQKLDEAITLAPSDSIIHMNAADELISTACREVIGDKIDLAKLRSSGNLQMLTFLYDTDAQKRTIAAQLSQHPAMIKAVSYLEKAMVLAPKLDANYQQLSSLYAFMENLEGMNRVANQLNNVEIDMADTIKRFEEYYAGTKDDYYTEIYTNRIDEYRRVQNTIDPGTDPYSYAVNVSNLLNTLFNMMDFNKKVDLDELVHMAKKNYELLPSNATRGDYYNALLIRAVETLQAGDDALAGLLKQYKRNLSHRYLLLVELENSNQIKNKLLNNKDIQDFIALLKEEVKNNASEAAASDWAMLNHLAPEFAKQIAENVSANQFNRLSLRINERLSPPTAALVYRQYWYHRMNGDNETASQLLQDATAKGVKLPLIAS
jgi:choline kinase